MKKQIALSLVISSILSASQMQTTEIADIQGELDSLAQTATQTRKNITYLPHIMSVFENKELSRAGALTLKDALSLVAGVEMSVDNLGMYNPIFRGSNPYAFGQSKLIVDGVEVNDIYFYGYTPYLTMPIEFIKRIEVVRGPGAFSVGHSSYAGSIVVTTYQEEIDRPKFNSQAFVGVGSYGQKRTGAAYSYQKDDVNFHIDAYTLQDDKKLKYGKDILNYGAYTAINIPLSQSGYGASSVDTKSLSFLLSNKNFYIKSRIMTYEHGAEGGLGYSLAHDGDKYSIPRYTLETGVKYRIGDTDGELKAGVLSEQFNIEGATSPAGTKLLGVEYINGLYIYREADLRSYTAENIYKTRIFGGLANYGIKAKWDTITNQKTLKSDSLTGTGLTDYSASAPFTNENGFISTANAFVDYEYALSANISANISLLAEKRNGLVGSLEPRFSIISKLSDEDRLKFFVSKEHRNPSWQEMYTLSNNNRRGNPALKPEVVYAYEAQYIHQFSLLSTLSFDLFYLRNYGQINKLNLNTYQNAGSSTIKGSETEWKSSFKNLTVYLAHTYQWGEDQNGRKLANTANHALKSHLIYEFDNRLWASTAWRYSGEKAREAGDVRSPLKAYQVADISLGYKIPAIKSELQLSVKNLFDQTVKYPSEPKTYADDYPGESRSVYLTIRSKF